MARWDLSELDWRLEGWRPMNWRWARPEGVEAPASMDLGPYEAAVPGSVQETLRRAGVLPDWHTGMQSLDCEWVEHRHWYYETQVPAGYVKPGEPVQLHALGLDYSGWILVDDRETAEFAGTLHPHVFDLTHWLGDGQPHRLGIVFDCPPPEQGQVGYTSQSVYFKPRYNYGWDWCPRFVPMGIWDRLLLRTGMDTQFAVHSLLTELDENLADGQVRAQVTCGGRIPEDARIHLTLEDNGKVCARSEAAASPRSVAVLELAAGNLEPWRPNGAGTQKRYTVAVQAVDAQGAELWREARAVGFKHIAWLPCENAPDGAEPWLCRINGEDTFLQGANWVPVRLSYGDVTRAQYAALLSRYRDMGANILRVWGGAILEKEDFYELCDEMGILVWQEFPLSSSGIENTPPEDPAVIARLENIARSYISRRAHHASLLMWCGGNELTGADGMPCDESHPCLAALKQVVLQSDPTHRFVATSPTGPRFVAAREDYGKGLHHDIHGPWGMQGWHGLEHWRQYWAEDDALFRSEAGMPGAAARGLIERYAGGLDAWPPDSLLWRHSSSWWTQWADLGEEFAAMPPETALDAYVRRTQELQAACYEIAARSCKSRFPACGGFIIWMGHDLFPCLANNSVITFDH